MSRFRYSPEMLRFLERGYREMRIPALTEAFNARFGQTKSPGQIKACVSNHGFTCGRKPGNDKGAFRIFTAQQAEFLRQMYRHHTVAELTCLFNAHHGTAFSVQQVKSFTLNHGIRSGRTGQFPKGHTPFNKGTKGAMKPNRTSFKKGCMTGAAQHNYKPIGTERISKAGYLERKVTDDPALVPARRWVGVHRLLWEEHHGEIPSGHVIVFLDGDKANVHIENLRCVPRGVLSYMNKTGLNETRGEARTAVILTAELVTRARQMEKRSA